MIISCSETDLKMLLETLPEFEIAGEASNGIEFLDLLKECNADIALMDINMPEMDGVEATRKGIKLCPSLSVIALSMYGEEEYYYKMVDAGAKGFLLKDSDISEVKEAILTVKKGGSYFSQELLHHVIQRIKNRETETKSGQPFQKGKRDPSEDLRGTLQPGDRGIALHKQEDC